MYLDDLNPVEELLAMLPGSPYECDVMYYAHSINRDITSQSVYQLKIEYVKYYYSLIV